ncbi:MAG: hypothetical protein FWD33_04355 [Alphaproteobacteria bacterium]|nr:hypothetical protein [Alphaproteobacteria bacterium]
MKKLLSLLLTSSLLLLPSLAGAREVVLYYMTTCPHCHYAKEFVFDTLVIEYPFVKFTQKNVQEPSNRADFERSIRRCRLNSFGVPLTIIGDKCFQGFNRSTSENEFREALNETLSDDERETVNKAAAELRANPELVRRNNAERIARARAENISVEKPGNHDWLYFLLGGLGLVLLTIIFFPRKKK